MKSFWLVKQEPSSYSWSDLVAEGETSWTGVRNFSARNNLRKMRKADQVLFYHSGDEKAVIGIAKVTRNAYPDPTAKEGDWSTVDLAAVKPLARAVTLREIKSNSRLKGIPLIRQSRLSVMPLAEPEFREIVNMAIKDGRLPSRPREPDGWEAVVPCHLFALFKAARRQKICDMSTIAATEFLPLVATASAAADSVVVSLHDVAPCTQQITSTIISELSAHGVRVCSVLVVPDYHHEGPFARHREFVTWLRALEIDGHEIVIHGYFHERPPQTKETLRDKFMTRFYTQNEGEFYDLSYEEALRRITTARDEFRALGLKPRGFIAPAWLLGNEAEQAVRDAELEYTTRLRTVSDLRSESIFPARTLVYSVHNNWRRALSRSWNAALFRLMRTKPLLRISIHPPDYLQPTIWKQILAFIAATKGARTATTYQDWIAEQRLKRGM